MSKKLSRRHPTFAVQMVALVMTALALLSFFLPFVSIGAKNGLGLLASLFKVSGAEGNNFSGFAGIFMFLSRDTIHESLNIGPLPTNLYLDAAFLFGALAIGFYFIRKWGTARFLIASLLNLASALSLILFPLRFTPYYAHMTKNGGQRFEAVLDDRQLVMTVKGGLIVCIILFFFSFMVNLLLYAQLKSDPMCRSAYIDD